MPAAPESSSPNDLALFGGRVRERRRALGLSLRELGERVDLTASFLAQVERGQASPSLASLRQIANVLQVPIFFFFTEERPVQRIVRRETRRRLHFPEANLTYEVLVPNLSRKSMGLMIRLGPGERISPVALSEPTEEWLLLLEGKVVVHVAGEQYELSAGDSISYEGWEFEGLVSTGNVEAVLVGNMSPPAF